MLPNYNIIGYTVVVLILTKLEKFEAVSLQVFLSNLFSFFLEYNESNIKTFYSAPHILEALLIFNYIFYSLFFRLDNCYWYIFRSMKCFLCHFHSVLESFHWIFKISDIVFFHSKSIFKFPLIFNLLNFCSSKNGK